VPAGAPFTENERLFHLTLLLAPQLEPRQQRAFLESAVEVMPTMRHRQVVRCVLAEQAVLSGELDAADQWLSAFDETIPAPKTC